MSEPITSLEVLQRFLLAKHEPGARFWSVREIAHEFKVSRYQAEIFCKKLVAEGFLEAKAAKGYYLSNKPVILSSNYKSSLPRPAFVWPNWGHSANKGSIVSRLRSHLMENITDRLWRASHYEEPGSWSDPIFPIRIAAKDHNIVIGVDPPRIADFHFRDLSRSGCRCLVIGATTSTLEHLGVPTIDGDERRATMEIGMRFKRTDCKNIIIVGALHSSSLRERFDGLSEAFDWFEKTNVRDFLIAELGPEYQAYALKERFDRRAKPDAVIFNHSEVFLHTIKIWPDFKEHVLGGVQVAVFDDLGITEQIPDIPFYQIQLDVAKMAKSLVDIVESYFVTGKIERRTLVPRVIINNRNL